MTQIYNLPTKPKHANMEIRIFGGESGGNVVFTPYERDLPNKFHRKMQELCFGVKWVKKDNI